MAKHVRWVRCEVPLFVKVVYDDAYEDDTVEKVIVVDEREDIRLGEDRSGHYEVFDAEFGKMSHLADKVVAIAEREWWPEDEILVHGEQWESGLDPRRADGAARRAGERGARAGLTGRRQIWRGRGGGSPHSRAMGFGGGAGVGGPILGVRGEGAGLLIAGGVDERAQQRGRLPS
ncbi:hypothetical protein O1L44_19700 [Streptomyces noursei]|uniref:hypothetical protein n=1 Tax=Streptomyces noursei TaxID=1971 RepID=UPI00081D14C1|nr:hypothetical protein SNOUR_24120 [Streptomyces noursei ATCC 11455]MCZ0994903.1 hypothetical protein [Streptomyces noursei]